MQESMAASRLRAKKDTILPAGRIDGAKKYSLVNHDITSLLLQGSVLKVVGKSKEIQSKVTHKMELFGSARRRCPDGVSGLLEGCFFDLIEHFSNY